MVKGTKVGFDRTEADTLQGQPVRGSQGDGVFGKACCFASTHRNTLEFVHSNNVKSELGPKEFPESCDSEGGTQADNLLFDLCPRILALVIVDGLLQIIEQIAENWPHGLHDLLGVFAAGSILLQAFGFGIRQMEGVLHGLSEVGSPTGNVRIQQRPRWAITTSEAWVPISRTTSGSSSSRMEAALFVQFNQTRIPSDRIQDGKRTNGEGLRGQTRIGPSRKEILHFGPSCGEDANFDLG